MPVVLEESPGKAIEEFVDAVGDLDVYCACARTSHQGTLGAPRSDHNVAEGCEHCTMGLVCRLLPDTMSIASLCAIGGCASSPTSWLQHGGSEV